MYAKKIRRRWKRHFSFTAQDLKAITHACKRWKCNYEYKIIVFEVGWRRLAWGLHLIVPKNGLNHFFLLFCFLENAKTSRRPSYCQDEIEKSAVCTRVIHTNKLLYFVRKLFYTRHLKPPILVFTTLQRRNSPRTPYLL